MWSVTSPTTLRFLQSEGANLRQRKAGFQSSLLSVGSNLFIPGMIWLWLRPIPMPCVCVCVYPHSRELSGGKGSTLFFHKQKTLGWNGERLSRPNPRAWLLAITLCHFHLRHLTDATLVLVIKQHRQEPQLNPLTSESSSTPSLKLPVCFMMMDYITHDTLLWHTKIIVM